MPIAIQTHKNKHKDLETI